MDDINQQIIPPSSRDSFDQYVIQPNSIMSFEFQIPTFGSLGLQLTHIYPNSQDLTINCWITSSPLDGLMLETGFGHFKPTRRSTNFVILDSFLKRDQYDDRLFLTSGRTWYLNVRNLQNKLNGFQASFVPLSS